MAFSIGVNHANFSRFYINKHFATRVRFVVSALHISGRNEDAAVSILTPSLDHIERLITIEKGTTVNNLKARRFKFDLETFTEEWQRMAVVRGQRDAIEEKRLEVGRKMKDIIDGQNIRTKSNKSRNHLDQVLETIAKQDSPTTVVCNEIEGLREEGKKLRSMLKDLMPTLWETEEVAITRALSLPNLLHEETPLVNDRLLFSSGTLPMDSDCPISKHVHLLNHSPTSYYLEDSVARQELDWIKLFSQRWKKDGFYPISAPDFVKSIIVDGNQNLIFLNKYLFNTKNVLYICLIFHVHTGCALDLNDPSQVWSLNTIEDQGSLENGNGLHLTGGASLSAIIAFLAKNVIQEPFPMRLFASGRTYQPAKESLGLINTAQASAVQLITALENNSDVLYEECLKIQNSMTDLLQDLVPSSFLIYIFFQDFS